MNDINEVVDLPAADTKPLLHPIDVAPARKSYLTSWWLSRLASLPVAFLFAVLLWRTSGNVITPALVPLLVLVIAALAGQYFAGQAWAHIPRNRQDHQRKQGAVLHIAAALIDAIALVSGLLVLLAWTSARDLSDDVEAFAIGAGAGIALLQLAEVTAAAARPSRDWMVVATQSLFLAAVTSTVLVAATTLVGDDWDTKADSNLGKKYPAAVATWENAWDRFTPFLAFGPALRKVIYTTNSIESLNYQLRKIIKNRGHFPNDDAVIKLLWLSIMNIEDKRARERAKQAGKGKDRQSIPRLVEGAQVTGWKAALGELALVYPDRINNHL